MDSILGRDRKNNWGTKTQKMNTVYFQNVLHNDSPPLIRKGGGKTGGLGGSIPPPETPYLATHMEF